MNLDDFCNTIKGEYPSISEKADKLYNDYWNSIVEMEFSSYSWFESLANAINDEMNRKVSCTDYELLFGSISRQFETGDIDTRKAIDVAFVENLFWEVGKSEALPYWDIMPRNLKDLYVGFHGQLPL